MEIYTPKRHSGFTLIELSIVLVIIGLIVGGVLVGQDLIRAAGVRAQISQIEKYNTAANTFYAKYGYLPGDIVNSAAIQFGFQPRATDVYNGTLQGNGDGIISGMGAGWGCCGETLMFWVDLSTAGLIDGIFNSATAGAEYTSTPTTIYTFMPAAKIGQGNVVQAWSDYCEVSMGVCPTETYTGNYFGISNITQMNFGGQDMVSVPGLTVMQAYSMDKKVDDGMPTSGRAMAYIPRIGPLWIGTADSLTPVSGSSTTCYDNSGNASSPIVYSINQNAGAGVNCALSFRFQ